MRLRKRARRGIKYGLPWLIKWSREKAIYYRIFLLFIQNAILVSVTTFLLFSLTNLSQQASKNQPGTACHHQHWCWQSTRPVSHPRCPPEYQNHPSLLNQKNLTTYGAAQGGVAWSAVSGANSNAMHAKFQHAMCSMKYLAIAQYKYCNCAKCWHNVKKIKVGRGWDNTF